MKPFTPGKAKFGDRVINRLGTYPQTRYVIGETPYSHRYSHPVIAMEGELGMPLSADWLEVESSGHDEHCMALRQKYLEDLPEGLKPL